MSSITVVIPTYNRRPLLTQAVRSVLAQTYSAWELIIVDDGSTDDTLEWLQTLRDGRIRWLHHERNAGPSAARNRGARDVSSSLIWFLDDDDVLKPRALEKLAERAEAHSHLPAVVGGARAFDVTGNQRKITHVFIPRRREVWPDLLLDWVPVTSATLIRRQALIEIGGFDENIRASEDVEMFLRLGSQGKFLLVPEVVVSKRNHPGQVWYPGTSDIHIAFKRRFVQSLQPASRIRAQALIEAADLWRQADANYSRGHPLPALKGFVAVARVKELRGSPVRRAYLAKDVLKATLSLMLVAAMGNKKAERVRRLNHRVARAVLKRRPLTERKVWRP